MLDIQVSLTGRITHPPRFFPADHETSAMWSAVLEVNGPPTPRRGGDTYVPTRYIEVVVHGVAAIRAHESYRKGHLVIAQGCDLLGRAYETRDRNGRAVLRGVVKVIATNLGLASRYTAVHEGAAVRVAEPSPRLVQGAPTAVAEEAALAG
ncbi:hypothetical protein ACFOWE_24595 [Planomonospora corallina]|uniref:Single-stranded DNA-binding protein n=1 Tax=Planomonospora corallina TaxID=1806052 RepID=A0ABV8IBS4_9ACTN